MIFCATHSRKVAIKHEMVLPHRTWVFFKLIIKFDIWSQSILTFRNLMRALYCSQKLCFNYYSWTLFLHIYTHSINITKDKIKYWLILYHLINFQLFLWYLSVIKTSCKIMFCLFQFGEQRWLYQFAYIRRRKK